MSKLEGCQYSRRIAPILGMALCAHAFNAHAIVEILFNQQPQVPGSSFTSSIPVGSQSADNFTAAGNVSVERVTWWGNSPGDPFSIRFFQDDASNPGNPSADPIVPGGEFLTGALAGTDPDQDGVFEYLFSLPNPLSLQAGTYYLSVVSDDDQFEWLWQEGSTGDSQNWCRAADGDAWLSGSDNLCGPQLGDLAFQLAGTRTQVPEPGTLSLLALLIGGLGVWGLWRLRQD